MTRFFICRFLQAWQKYGAPILKLRTRTAKSSLLGFFTSASEKTSKMSWNSIFITSFPTPEAARGATRGSATHSSHINQRKPPNSELGTEDMLKLDWAFDRICCRAFQFRGCRVRGGTTWGLPPSVASPPPSPPGAPCAGKSNICT